LLNLNFFGFIKNILNYEEPQTYDNQKELSVEDYIEKRYKKQLDWYEKQAVQSRVTYYTLQILIVLAGALIPLINVFPSDNNNLYTIKIISSILGSFIVIFTGVLQITKSNENWISYRSTAELMKSEYQRFKMGVGDYSEENLANKENRSILFIERMETIIAEEGKKFMNTHVKSEFKTKTKID
jgi:hypothetical protein